MRKFLYALVASLLIANGAPASAAEIKALVSTAMKAPFTEIAAQFEKATGNKVIVSFGPTGGLTKRIADGEAVDLLILGVPPVMPENEGLGSLIKQGKIAPNSWTTVARGLIGVGVKTGSPKPDISSEASFKAALLAAKAIAVTDPASGGSSGVYFSRLFERMGLMDALKPKLKYAAGGPNGYSGTIAARGEADFALQPIAELMSVPGIEVVGPLPGAFQNATSYTAAIPANAKAADEARALIKALTAPAAAPIYKSKGLDPA